MTDTANMLTDSIKHSFILKFERPWHNNAITGWAIPFRQRYSFDSIFSGGYIEVSYNHGASWLTIYDKTPFKEIGKYNSGLYTPSDTLTNGTAALNGNLTWDFKERANCEAYFFCTTDGAVLVNSVWLKFTYLNLARNNPHEGWLIDDIEFNIFVSCEFITDGFEQTTISSKIKTYPNPANNLVTIEYPMAAGNGYLLTLYDYSGKLQLKQYAVCGENHQLDISPYPNGYYIYTLVDENGKQLIGKFIINR
jgi:hypothetical protein